MARHIAMTPTTAVGYDYENLLLYATCIDNIGDRIFLWWSTTKFIRIPSEFSYILQLGIYVIILIIVISRSHIRQIKRIKLYKLHQQCEKNFSYSYELVCITNVPYTVDQLPNATSENLSEPVIMLL